MRGSACRERRYRRLLKWYPPAFRREHEQEVLAVLMAGAEDGRWAPGFAESADLIRSAMRMRLRPGGQRSTPTMFAAVGLMYVGAAVELATLITIVSTLGDLKSAILQRNPRYTAADWHAEMAGHMIPLAVSAAIAVGVWLWMAWANGRGRRWARIVFAAFFCLNVTGLLSGLAQGSATYAPADLIAGSVLCLVALAAVVLIFNKASEPHYMPPPTHG
jgi:hypothetical protein